MLATLLAASPQPAHAEFLVPISTSPLMYDLTLEEYAQVALSSSLEIKTALDNLESNRFAWLATLRSLYAPSVNAVTNAGKSYTDTDTSPASNTKSLSSSLTLSQPLPTGTDISIGPSVGLSETNTHGPPFSESRSVPAITGTINQGVFLFVANPRLRTKTQADINYANARDQYESQRLSILFNAKSQYYTALLNLESMKVQQKKFESGQIVHNITKELVRVGKLAPVELSRAGIQRNTDLRAIQNVESQSQQALNSAKNLILIPLGAELKLSSRLEYHPFKISLERLIREANQHNPSLLSAARGVTLSEIGLQQSKEGNRPLVNLSGNYTTTRDRSIPGWPRQPNSWSTNLGITWSIFDADQTPLRIRQSQISLENSKRSFELSRRQVELSVQNAYLDLKRIENQIQDFSTQRMIARQNVEAVRLQYQNGLSRLIDIFDAENQLRDLELEYLNLLVSFNRSRDNLSQQVGLDLEKLAP